MQVSGLRALVVDEPLADAIAVAAGKVLVDAQGEDVALAVIREREGVATDESRDVRRALATVGEDEEVFVLAQAKNHHRHRLLAMNREPDAVVPRGRRDLRGQQWHGVDRARS